MKMSMNIKVPLNVKMPLNVEMFLNIEALILHHMNNHTPALKFLVFLQILILMFLKVAYFSSR